MKSISLPSTIEYLTKLKLHYIAIPSNVLLQLNDGEEKGKFNQRVIIEVNNSINWHGGIVALGEGKGYVAISKARMKELNVQLEDVVQIRISKDTSDYGHEIPIELSEVLNQDPEAKYRFDNMTPGKQRVIIYYVLQVKNSDKRIERSLEFANNLKRSTPGKETMRQLFGKE